MGTNFYVDADPTCDNPAHTERLHIGKSSGGWKFGFRAYPDRGLVSWEAWQAFLADDARRRPVFGMRPRGRTITDEYGTELTPAEFAGIVEAKQAADAWCRVAPSPDCIARGFGGMWSARAEEFHDPAGYDFHDGEFS